MSVTDVRCKSTELIATFLYPALLFIVINWRVETENCTRVRVYTLLLFLMHAVSTVCVYCASSCMCLYVFVYGRLTRFLQASCPGGIACSISSQKLLSVFSSTPFSVSHSWKQVLIYAWTSLDLPPSPPSIYSTLLVKKMPGVHSGLNAGGLFQSFSIYLTNTFTLSV